MVEVTEDDINRHLDKLDSLKQLESIFENLKASGSINKVEIVDYGYKDTEKEITPSNVYLFDVNERQMQNYLHGLEVKINYANTGVYKFKYGIEIDLEQASLTHNNIKYPLPLGKDGVRLLTLLLNNYPNITTFGEISNHFNLFPNEKNRIYEIRDDLKSLLTKNFKVSVKTANKFFENIRGIGYKITLNSEKSK
jgi:DNA-binding winged helix-turn-helix (wHTH) protein